MRKLIARLRDRFQSARAEKFVALMRPRAGASLLDLGGGDGSLSERIRRYVPLRVTVADLDPTNREAALQRGFRHVLLPEEDRLPFQDGEFDYVLCNSVIEHVTLRKARCAVRARVPQGEWDRESKAAQRRFAAEIARVGKAYFVQTPDYRFPIDQHVQLPLVHFLSHNAQCRVVALTDRYWIKKCQGMVDWRLLTPRTLGQLFPGATIHVERFAWLPKSVIAYRGLFYQ